MGFSVDAKMTEEPGRMAAQARQLAAFTAKSGEQKFATMNDLRVILYTSNHPSIRTLDEGRAACNCCGEMVTAVLDTNNMQFCVPCITEAQQPPEAA